MAPARSLQRAAAIAAAALLAPLAAAAPAAAETHDGRTVLSVGHTDAMQVYMNGGELDLRVKDDTGEATRYHDPDDVLFQVLPHAETAIPDHEDYTFLGEAGDPMWLLPLAQDHTLLWPGWNTEPLANGQFKDDEVQMTLVGVEGPGELALWTNGNFGEPNVLFNTADGLPDALDVMTYAHVHSTWAFMAEGAYTLTWEVSGTLADGTEVATGNVDYRWHVGELGDEDPDPDPDDPDLPDESDLDGRLVLDEGHVDVMSVHRTATGLELRTKDGTRLHGPADVYRDPDSVVLHATPASETTLGAHFTGPGYDQVGAPGDRRWLLPDTQKPGVLFAGWETGSIAEGTLAGDAMSLSLTGFSGPGDLVMLNVDDFGGAAAAVDTAQALPQSIPTMAHSHVHTNWYFSEPGIYRLTWQAAAEAADGTALASAPQDFLFVVGEWPDEAEDPDDPGDPDDPVLESTQTITATVDTDAGGLVISVDPSDRDVVLPAMTLNSTATRWTTEGELRPVTVTDTRSADPGWNAAAQVSAFRHADGEFSSAHLGWTPGLVTSGGSQQVTPGPTVPGLLDGGPGLATSQILAAAATGAGTGTCVLDADLRLDLPTDAESGTYTALVTFTAI